MWHGTCASNKVWGLRRTRGYMPRGCSLIQFREMAESAVHEFQSHDRRTALGRSMQRNPSRANTPSRPRCSSPRRCTPAASGHASIAVAPSLRASAIAACSNGRAIPEARWLGSMNKQATNQTVSSSSRGRSASRLLRPAIAAVYRARGPQAHQPTGFSPTQASTPIGAGLEAVIDSNRRWFPPPYQPAANCQPVVQNAMHQQWRVVRPLSNKRFRSSNCCGPTGRTWTSATCEAYPDESTGKARWKPSP